MRTFLLSLTILLCIVSMSRAEMSDVDQPAVCYLCHEDVQDQERLRSVHTGFGAGECSACHNPHASSHAALLDDDETDLCGSCHEDQVAVSKFPHAPVARGECLSCHDPHASAHANQLKVELVEQCAQCHAPVRDWSRQTFVHDPVRSGDCGSCHNPHGSEQDALLKTTVLETCFTCHEADAAMMRAHASPVLAQSDCTMCHDPHASGLKGLLRSNQHKPFAANNCQTCHGKMEGRNDFSVADVRDLCERCHRGTKSFADELYQHNLDTEESCAQCHNAHASNVNSLLLSAPEELCASCHFNEPEREKPKAEYMTHDAMDCTECHLPHGASNPRYLKATDSELCSGCHTTAHNVSHPVGPEVIDARTGEPVTCLSCHQLHGADFEFYIPLDPTRELCIQCHRR